MTLVSWWVCAAIQKYLIIGLKNKIYSNNIVGRICSEGVLNIKWKDKHEVMALGTKHINGMVLVPNKRQPNRKKKPQYIIY